MEQKAPKRHRNRRKRAKSNGGRNCRRYFNNKSLSRSNSTDPESRPRYEKSFRHGKKMYKKVGKRAARKSTPDHSAHNKKRSSRNSRAKSDNRRISRNYESSSSNQEHIADRRMAMKTVKPTIAEWIHKMHQWTRSLLSGAPLPDFRSTRNCSRLGDGVEGSY